MSTAWSSRLAPASLILPGYTHTRRTLGATQSSHRETTTRSPRRSAGECKVATHAACQMPRGPPPEGKQLLGREGLTLSDLQGRLPAASPLAAHTWRCLGFLCKVWCLTDSASLPALWCASCFPAKCSGHLQACHHLGCCAAPPQRMTLQPPLQQNSRHGGPALWIQQPCLQPAISSQEALPYCLPAWAGSSLQHKLPTGEGCPPSPAAVPCLQPALTWRGRPLAGADCSDCARPQ